jgi:hypothetical protein
MPLADVRSAATRPWSCDRSWIRALPGRSGASMYGCGDLYYYATVVRRSSIGNAIIDDRGRHLQRCWWSGIVWCARKMETPGLA